MDFIPSKERPIRKSLLLELIVRLFKLYLSKRADDLKDSGGSIWHISNILYQRIKIGTQKNSSIMNALIAGALLENNRKKLTELTKNYSMVKTWLLKRLVYQNLWLSRTLVSTRGLKSYNPGDANEFQKILLIHLVRITLHRYLFKLLLYFYY